MSTKVSVEGIILHSFPFKEHDAIFSLFSLSEGLMKCIQKGAYSKKKAGSGNALAPFSKVEIVYSIQDRNREGLGLCHEIDVLNYNYALRETLPRIEAASEIVNAVLSTQQLGRPAPLLYHLMETYLAKLPSALFPLTVSASFYLKVLRIEGLFPFAEECFSCRKRLRERYFFEKELACSLHAPPNSLELLEEEYEISLFLAYCQKFTQLIQLELPQDYTEKIKTLFHHYIA